MIKEATTETNSAAGVWFWTHYLSDGSIVKMCSHITLTTINWCKVHLLAFDRFCITCTEGKLPYKTVAQENLNTTHSTHMSPNLRKRIKKGKRLSMNPNRGRTDYERT